MLQVIGPVVAVGLTVWSAIVAKELGAKPPLLASVDRGETVTIPETVPEAAPVSFESSSELLALGSPVEFEPTLPAQHAAAELDPATRALAADPAVRWFDGRPVRPARIMTMVVTAYSPDEKSCGPYADGITATLHSVATNGFALVAADPTVLRYGSMLTVPGYDQDRIVPVLDCGSDIKGRRLDVIFPTDAQARKWGRKTLKVVVWEYADGKPAPNPRRMR
jgi:3D (Asp-Asp-Asp) domain-containing protein